MLDEIQFITPFLLFLDHLSEMAWYLPLVKRATQGRKKLHVISTHLSNVGLILVGAAIFGAISRKWGIALEVFLPILSLHDGRTDTSQIQLIICTMSAISNQPIA
jgi:small neutral amino acid transporter SnatA (MarC family)